MIDPIKLQSLLDYYKQRLIQFDGLKGANDELYKWTLLTKYQGRPDVNAEDFAKEVQDVRYNNLVYPNVTHDVIKTFAENCPEEYREIHKHLFDENRDVDERITEFRKECSELYAKTPHDPKKQNTSHDDRTAATLLTYHDPQKYTFFKPTMYERLCKFIGIEAKQKNRYSHYLQIINELAAVVDSDPEIQAIISRDTENLISSKLLNAQDVVYEVIEKTLANTDNKMAKDIRYFVGSAGEPEKDYSDKNFADCVRQKAHIMADETFQKGVFDEVSPGDVLFLKYRRQLVAWGEVCRKQNTAQDGEKDEGWNYKIFVKEWHFYDAYNHNIGASKYGIQEHVIAGSQYATVKEISDDFAKSILSQFEKKRMESIIETSTAKLLLQKKQIILQGAPGTGKTYKTASLAVEICDNGLDKALAADREKLMKRYRELENDGRIAFTTFHQSMDYEEFVEGIKPSIDNGNTVFNVEPGIFKRICEDARFRQTKTNSFELAWNELKADVTKHYAETGKPYELKTKTGSVFGITVNSNGNFNLYTGPELNHNGSLKKENFIMQLHGEDKFIGWEGYYNGLIDKLRTTYHFIEDEDGASAGALLAKDYSDKSAQQKPKNYVLIIDEINRGNISKILGELITLLEVDKREGEVNEVKVKLPYSKDVDFTVPSNLYIIGTMNTADRSVGYIDYAIRRRFAFETIRSNENGELNQFYENCNDKVLKDTAIAYFDKVKRIIKDGISEDYDADDLMVGHSYFMAETKPELDSKLEYEVKPLLLEYLRDGILTGKTKAEIEACFNEDDAIDGE